MKIPALFVSLLITAWALVACNFTGESTSREASSTSRAVTPPTVEEGELDSPPDSPIVAVVITPTPEAESATLEELLSRGEALYLGNCAPCHQPNGEGMLNSFPALNSNPLVTTENPSPAIDVVLHGRGVMPSFAGALSPQQIAAILSYVRNAWDNEAAVVKPEQVREVQESAALSSE